MSVSEADSILDLAKDLPKTYPLMREHIVNMLSNWVFSAWRPSLTWIELRLEKIQQKSAEKKECQIECLAVYNRLYAVFYQTAYLSSIEEANQKQGNFEKSRHKDLLPSLQEIRMRQITDKLIMQGNHKMLRAFIIARKINVNYAQVNSDYMKWEPTLQKSLWDKASCFVDYTSGGIRRYIYRQQRGEVKKHNQKMRSVENLLIEFGADVNANQRPINLTGTYTFRPSRLKSYVDAGLNLDTENAQTLVRIAALWGRGDLLRVLIFSGVNIAHNYIMNFEAKSYMHRAPYGLLSKAKGFNAGVNRLLSVRNRVETEWRLKLMEIMLLCGGLEENPVPVLKIIADYWVGAEDELWSVCCGRKKTGSSHK